MRANLDPGPLLALFPGQPGKRVARLLGVAPSTVSKWRLGRARIRPSVADRVAAAAGLHMAIVWPDGTAQRSACGRGHDLTGDTAYHYPTGEVACRTCRGRYRLAWRERQATA